MEKKRAQHDLSKIKAMFVKTSSLNITRTALNDAMELGLSLEDIVEVIGKMTHKQFFKSMTSKVDHKIWQDVYHVFWREYELYVKFTTDSMGNYLLIGFKEK